MFLKSWVSYPFFNSLSLTAVFLLLIVSSSFSAAAQIVSTNLHDTAMWKFNYSDENIGEYTLSYDSSGVTFNVIKRTEHEYDAMFGTPCSLNSGTTYTIAIKARSDSSDQIALGFLFSESPWFSYATRAIKLNPSDSIYTLHWLSGQLNLFGITPPTLFTIKLGKIRGKITLSDVSVTGSPTTPNDIDDFECPLKPKTEATIGDPSALPDGYIVFCDMISKSMHITNLRTWNPIPIKNTDTIYNMSLSGDGRWILYRSGSRAYLLRIDGKFETNVPSPNSITTTGFLRNSPYGDEIFFDNIAGHNYLYATQTTLSDTSAYFGSRRVIAQIGPNWEFERYYNLHISRDQIWGEIHPLIDGNPRLRSSFLTIPDSGRGIATSDNIYKFTNDDFEQVWGCNHAMSHDGKYCLAIPGNAGETGDYCHCAPPAHAGFYITRFYHYNDSSIDMRESVHKYAVSLNWCPRQYRFGIWSEVDFANYNFSNDSRYVVASQTGTLSPRKGLWVIDWEKNIWYPVSPDSCKIEGSTVAMYIGSQNNSLLSGIIPNLDTSTISTPADDPIGYKILKPSGGELFHTGEQCTIKVVSRENGNASIKLQFGKNSLNLFNTAINPRVDSILVVNIPEFFLSRKIKNGVIINDTIYPYSNSCKIVVEHYIAGVAKSASSEGYFTIASSSAINPMKRNTGIKKQLRFSSMSISSFFHNPEFSMCTEFTIYDCMGRMILNWNRNSGTPAPVNAGLKYNNRYGFYLVKAEYLAIRD